VSTYTIRLDLTRPLMTSNEQRRAHWTKVREAKSFTELSVCNVLRRRGDVAVTPPVDVHLTWYVPDARRRDSDSLGPCLKACLDALVKAFVIPDDSSEYVRRSGSSVVVDRADPRIELQIVECEQPKDAA